jgi:hypothetical protein
MARHTAVLSRGRHIVGAPYCVFFYPVGGSMANTALPMQCPSDTLPFCGLQPLCKGQVYVPFLILFAISPRRAKLGGVTREMRSAGAPPLTPANWV